MSHTLPASPGSPLIDERASLRQVWVFLFVLSLASFLVGFLEISSAFWIATLATVTVFGTLLIIAGITQVLFAVMVRNGRGFALHLLAAALYLIVGVFMLEDPVRAAAVLTLLLVASFFVGGMLRILFSLIGRFPGWPWVLLNGAVDLVLGAIILNGWPESSIWVLGVFVGIELLFNGLSGMILALNVRTFNAAPSA